MGFHHCDAIDATSNAGRASSTPGEDLPPEAARFVAQVMSPEQPPLPPIVADLSLIHI